MPGPTKKELSRRPYIKEDTFAHIARYKFITKATRNPHQVFNAVSAEVFMILKQTKSS